VTHPGGRRVVLVTGASSGIGAGLARECARPDTGVCLFARRADRLEAVAQEVTARGGDALAVVGDVTKDGDVEKAVTAALERWGRLDVVYANAGFGVSGPVATLSLDDFRRQLETNVMGVLRTIQATLPALKTSRGRLGIIGSVAGYVASPGTAPYCMSKFAVRALANALRHEVRGQGVSVTHVAPGFIASEIRLRREEGRIAPPDEDPVPRWLVMPADKAARIIVRAVERRRAEVVVTGHGKVLVWLVRHVPFFVDWAMSHGARRPGVRHRE